jgi:hypothetical protein
LLSGATSSSHLRTQSDAGSSNLRQLTSTPYFCPPATPAWHADMRSAGCHSADGEGRAHSCSAPSAQPEMSPSPDGVSTTKEIGCCSSPSLAHSCTEFGAAMRGRVEVCFEFGAATRREACVEFGEAGAHLLYGPERL